jgi:hypothetical protein
MIGGVGDAAFGWLVAATAVNVVVTGAESTSGGTAVEPSAKAA